MKTSYKELVSKMSYSPSLLDMLPRQIKLYAKHHRLRSITLALSLLLLGLNVYLYTSPIQSSVAASDNDLIYGGLTGSENTAKRILLQVWDNNQNPGGGQESDIQNVFASFGVDRSDIENSSERKICTRGCEETKELKILGRKSGHPMQTRSLSGYYYTDLDKLFKDNGLKYQKSLRIKSDIYVLYGSGNIVFKDNSKRINLLTSLVDDHGTPIQPELNTKKINYRVFVSSEADKPINGPKISIKLPDSIKLEAAYPVRTSTTNNGRTDFSWQKLNPNANQYFDLVMSLDPDKADSEELCIVSTFSAIDAASQTKTDCYKTTSAQEQPRVNAESLLQPPPTDKTLIPSFGLETSIRVKNLTQNTEPKLNSEHIGEPGDRLLYTVDINNDSQQDFKNKYIPGLVLSDALQYATLTKPNGGVLSDDMLLWPAFNIRAGEHVQKTFELQVNINANSSPQPNSDPRYNDCIISISYGNESNQKIDCGNVKLVEQSMQKLPVASSRLVLSILFLVSLACLYYFMNSRRAKNELVQLRRSYLFSEKADTDER